MTITLRPATIDDAEILGRICHRAFTTLAENHNFPSDFPVPEMGIGLLRMLTANPGFYGVVAMEDDRIVGSNFIDERASVIGLGPITIDPEAQNKQVGRQLMLHMIERVRQQERPSVRLVQAAYHTRSLALYSKLGFEAREMLSNLQGPPIGLEIPGFAVRSAVEEDLDACSELCFLVHGFSRRRELADAIGRGTALVTVHDGRITGYATDIGFGGHAVAEENESLKALISAAPAISGPGLLLPTRNSEVFRWCLQNGLRLVQQMTYMSIGLYNEPQGAYLPSILL